MDQQTQELRQFGTGMLKSPGLISILFKTMDFLLPLGAAGAAITKYLYERLNKWNADSPPRTATLAEAQEGHVEPRHPRFIQTKKKKNQKIHLT